jgi:hypothetical protein
MAFGGRVTDMTLLSNALVSKTTDWILRVRQSENYAGPRIFLAPTESVARPIHNLMAENAVLKGVVKNLWKIYKYNQEYQAFLLGGCSEDEFLAIAEQFAAAFDDIPEEQLVYASSFLLTLLDEPLTSNDLSVLLNADPSDIEKALSSSSNVQRIRA